MRFSCKKDISWLFFCSFLFADTAENRDSFSSQDKKISLWSRENSKWRLLHISWWKMPLRRFHLYSSFATGLRRSQNLSWTKGQKKRRNLLLSFLNRSRKNKASFQDTHYYLQMIVVTWHTKWMNKMNLNLCCGCQRDLDVRIFLYCGGRKNFKGASEKNILENGGTSSWTLKEHIMHPFYLEDK